MNTLLLLLMLASGGARAEVVDRIVAQIDDELVLDSEVRLEAALARLDASPMPFWDAGHDAPLNRLVDAAVVRAGIGDLGIYQPAAAEVQVRREAVRMRFGNRDDWQAFLTEWGLDEAALDVILRRRMLVERYFGRNLQVDPADRRRWLLEADGLIADLRLRTRVRMIEEQAQ